MKINPEEGERMSFTFDEYQENAAKTALPCNQRLTKAILGISGEAGECAEAMKKYVRGDFDKEELKRRLVKEMGDELWYLAECCTAIGVSLEDVAKANNAKLLKRLEENKIQGDGDNR